MSISSWLDISLGGQTTFMDYEQGKRENVNSPKYDQKRSQSINALIYLKPAINLWRVSLYGLAGFGPDYMDVDGLDTSYMYGLGLNFNIYENATLGLSQQEIIRLDTGRYRMNSIIQFSLSF